MKAAAFILALILGILLAEPAFTNFSFAAANRSCSILKTAEKSCCKSKSKFKKPVQKDEKKGCENNRCNPFMSCPLGNFYLLNVSQLSLTSWTLPKQKTPLVNDNRISKQLTECFHPPEII